MESKDIKLISTEELLKIFYNADVTIAKAQQDATQANANKVAVSQELNRREQIAQDIKVKVKKATGADEAADPTDDADPPAHE